MVLSLTRGPDQEIAGLFNNSPDCPPSIKCTFAHNNSWFVEFRTEHEALQAYSYFREHPHYFHGDLIKVTHFLSYPDSVVRCYLSRHASLMSFTFFYCKVKISS